jgi:hypothetical protein
MAVSPGLFAIYITAIRSFVAGNIGLVIYEKYNTNTGLPPAFFQLDVLVRLDLFLWAYGPKSG